MTAAFMSLRKKPTHRTNARRARSTCQPQVGHKYTVILQRPDYVTNDFGQDTLFLYAEGADPAEAVAAARKDAAKADGLKGDWGKDYFVVAVMPGWQADLNPERRQ